MNDDPGDVRAALDQELASCESEHPAFSSADDEVELRRRALKNLRAGLGLGDDAA